MRTICLAFLFSAAVSAQAAIQISKITGASVANTGQDGTVTLVAGTAGPVCLSVDGGTCDSCAVQMPGTLCVSASGHLGPFCACNPNRIVNYGWVKMDVLSKTSGSLVVTDAGGRIQYYGTPVAADHAATLAVPWANICNMLAFSPFGCEGLTMPLEGKIRVGITQDGVRLADSQEVTVRVVPQHDDQITDCDASSGGICGFRVMPGSQSAYLEQTQGTHGMSSAVKAIRVYASDVDFYHAAPGWTRISQDLIVQPDGTIESTAINGLKNDVPYYFRVASLDEAGNIFNFTSNTNIEKTGKCKLPVDDDANDDCQYRTIPTDIH